jgi:hypothetical protein|nr:MAG TPA: hypothetical protein [Caudoviricetes sp.]
MHATLSFNGLLAGYPELFNDLKVPDSVSKEAVCNQLLFDTLELEVLYADGPTMQRALGVFSETMLPSWTRYAAALGLDYDVLASDDRTRTTDHHGTNSGTNSSMNLVTGTTKRTPDLTTTGKNNGSDSTTRDVTGFDSGTMVPAEKSTTTLGTGNTITSTGTDTTTDDQTTTNTSTTEAEDGYKDTVTEKGRAGKDPQDLIAKELTLAAKNAVNKIVADIQANFCLLVY